MTKCTLWLIFIISLASCRQFDTEDKKNIISYEDLATGFQAPPDSIKPWVYWYWISDNISGEGITQDLEMMADLGIGAALIGNIFLPDVPRGPIPILSDEWYALTEHAIREGQRLGVDIGLFNGPGWVQSGGPWVDSTQAMRYVTYSAMRVEGPTTFEGKLETPHPSFQDIATLAYPLPNEEKMASMPLKISSSLPLSDANNMIDGSVKTGCAFPVNLMEEKPLMIDLEFAQPFAAKSMVLHPQEEPFSVDVELQVWEDDQFRSVRHFYLNRSNNMPTVGPIAYGPAVIAFPKILSKKYRLIFTRLNQGEVWFTDVKREGGIAEIILSEAPRLENYVEKQLGKMHQLPMPMWGDYQWDEQEEYQNDTLSIYLDEVRNITQYLGEDGNLRWKVPEGEWMILRIGMTPTGVTNAPVSEEALGLDVDKMSKENVRKHFNAYLGPLIENIPSDERQALKYLVADSYETGSQNWTDGLAAVFEQTYGYDPLPWLPVLTGRVVQTPELSDRFLWDLRRLVADQIGENYIGGLQEVAHENGLKLWVENYGHWGFPGEFLQYGSHADLLAGEFWAEGNLGNIECRAAASAAHIYGKKPVFAEALTAAREHYTRYPALLRRRGDWSFTQGINHFVLHVYIQQPYEERFPGVNAWFGVEFNRHNTWFPHAKSWIDYIRRSNFLLQQGEYQADVCYFIGEGAPLMTGIQEPPLPPGFSFDYINADVILNRLMVKNGRLTLPNGISYSLMVLPPLPTMTPQLLGKIKELVEKGATILGAPPGRSPSLRNYPICDEEVQKMADQLWAGYDGEQVKAMLFGQGNVLCGMNLTEAFDHLQVKPDLEMPDNMPVAWIHRADQETDIFFLTNQSDSILDFTATFRVHGRQPEIWDALSGAIRALPEYRMEQGRTSVPLQFAPGQSYFLVFAQPVSSHLKGENFPQPNILFTLADPWNVSFDSALRGPEKPVVFEQLIDWTEHPDDRIRYYSGLATYQTSFVPPHLPDSGRLYLSLGQVHSLAKIRLNGKDVGGVWTDPWQVEITPYIKEGKNELEIDVVNTWVNRIIKDSDLPEAERLTWTAINPYQPDHLLQPAGLAGPVTIIHLE